MSVHQHNRAVSRRLALQDNRQRCRRRSLVPARALNRHPGQQDNPRYSRANNRATSRRPCRAHSLRPRRQGSHRLNHQRSQVQDPVGNRHRAQQGSLLHVRPDSQAPALQLSQAVNRQSPLPGSRLDHRLRSPVLDQAPSRLPAPVGSPLRSRAGNPAGVRLRNRVRSHLRFHRVFPLLSRRRYRARSRQSNPLPVLQRSRPISRQLCHPRNRRPVLQHSQVGGRRCNQAASLPAHRQGSRQISRRHCLLGSPVVRPPLSHRCSLRRCLQVNLLASPPRRRARSPLRGHLPSPARSLPVSPLGNLRASLRLHHLVNPAASPVLNHLFSRQACQQVSPPGSPPASRPVPPHSFLLPSQRRSQRPSRRACLRRSLLVSLRRSQAANRRRSHQDNRRYSPQRFQVPNHPAGPLASPAASRALSLQDNLALSLPRCLHSSLAHTPQASRRCNLLADRAPSPQLSRPSSPQLSPV